MEESKKTQNNIFTNDLDRSQGEQSVKAKSSGVNNRDKSTVFIEKLKESFRNGLIVAVCIITGVFWYYDWNASVVADKTSELVSTAYQQTESLIESFAPIPPPAPVATNPPKAPQPVDAPAAPEAPNPGPASIEQYISELREQGIANEYSNATVTTFYESQVSIDFLKRLTEVGLSSTFSSDAIVAFSKTGVPVSYINHLKKEGLLTEFSYSAIVAFHQNNVPVAYLNELKAKGQLQNLSFSDIVYMHRSKSS